MPHPHPRLRQAVIAAHDLAAAEDRLRTELRLGEPFSDPAVHVFGLENRVFALSDTFLEVVSPVAAGTAAGRWLERRGGDCGYMVMFEVDDLDQARRRAQARQVRTVFEVELEDMAEVHLHPADMRGAIVALSAPRPPGSWRWGGPDWQERSCPLRVEGVTISTPEPEAAAELWSELLGSDAPGVTFAKGRDGLLAIAIAGIDGEHSVKIGSVALGSPVPAERP